MSKITKYEETRIDFIKWHREYPEVWEIFEEACWKAISKGHRSAKVGTILGGVGWKMFIQLEREMKFPNYVGAFYARMWNKKNSEMPLFKIKEMDGEARWKSEQAQQQDLFGAKASLLEATQTT